MKAVRTAAFAVALVAAGAAAQDGAPDAGFGSGLFGAGRIVMPFNLGGDDADVARAVAVDGSGRVVAAGTVTTAADDLIGVMRLLPDGQPDAAFDGDGATTLALSGSDLWVEALALYGDGRIVLAGHTRIAADRNFYVARLRADGTPDPQFGIGGIRIIDFNLPSGAADEALAVAIAADGGVLVAGTAGSAVSTRRMAVVRLTPSGASDPAFSGDGRVDFAFGSTPANDFLHAIVERPDGRVLLAGSSDVGGNIDFALVQLTAAGAGDAGFGSYGPGRSLVAFDLGGSNSDTARALRIGAGGAVFVAGTASSSASAARFAVARLTPAGLLDASFFGGGRQTVDFAGDGAAYAVCSGLALQSDGRIVLGGQAARAVVGFDFATARLLATGQIDTSFGTQGRALLGFDLGAGNADNGHAMALAQGRIVMAGGVQRMFNGGADRDFGITRQQLDLLFADGFQ